MVKPTIWDVLQDGDIARLQKEKVGSFSDYTEKTVPVDEDVLVIEDSQDSNAKKTVQIGNLLENNAELVKLYYDGVSQSMVLDLVSDSVTPGCIWDISAIRLDATAAKTSILISSWIAGTTEISSNEQHVDVGDPSGITFSTSKLSGSVKLKATITAGTWDIRVVRMMETELTDSRADVQKLYYTDMNATAVVDTIADTDMLGCTWNVLATRTDASGDSKASFVNSIWVASTDAVNSNEQHVDSGDPSGITFGIDIVGNQVRLKATVTAGIWDVQVLRMVITVIVPPMSKYDFTGLITDTVLDTIVDASASLGAIWSVAINRTDSAGNAKSSIVNSSWIMASTAINYNEQHVDIGSLAGISLLADIDSNNVRLRALITSGTWDIQIVRILI